MYRHSKLDIVILTTPNYSNFAYINLLNYPSNLNTLISQYYASVQLGYIFFI